MGKLWLAIAIGAFLLMAYYNGPWSRPPAVHPCVKKGLSRTSAACDAYLEDLYEEYQSSRRDDFYGRP
jgi:hypothetical protein